MNKENIDAGVVTQSQSRGKVGVMPGLVTVGPHRSARAMIMQAVDMLETENDELRKLNGQMMQEMDKLREENDHLRQKVAEVGQRMAAQQSQTETTLREQKHTLQELDSERNKRLKTEELAQQLEEQNQQYIANIDTLKKDVTEKSSELNKMAKEIEIIKDRLIGNEKYLGERDIELFHKVERLKEEKKGWLIEKEQFGKLNQSLQQGVKELENQLGDSSAELKNENRRHALLAREFNSLLEENNQLKQQLRKRRGSVNFPSVTSSPRAEREETMVIQRENTRLKMTASLDNLSAIGREHDDGLNNAISGRSRRGSMRENKRQLVNSSLLREGKSMKSLEPIINNTIMEQNARDRLGDRQFTDVSGTMSDVVYYKRKSLSGGSDSNNSERGNTPKENRRQFAPTKVSTSTSINSTNGQINVSLVAGFQGGTDTTNSVTTPKIVSSSSVSALPQTGNGKRGSISPPDVTRANAETLPSVPEISSKTWRP